MKRFINILIFCFLQQVLLSQNHDTDSIKKILILNSYRPEIVWSNNLAKSIETQLHKNFPDANIHTGNIGSSNMKQSNITTSIKSILNSFSENDSIYPDEWFQNAYSIFSTSHAPDLLICIGTESLLMYQNYGFLLNDEWFHTPIIWTGINDSVIKGIWKNNISDSLFSQSILVENRRSITRIHKRSSFLKTYKSIEYSKNYQTILNSKDELSRLTFSFNITGVKNLLAIEDNILLIKNLIPNVKELVFVDEDYYTTQYIRWVLKRKMPEILPDIQYTNIIHTKNINTDSIFNLILNPVEGRVFLTFSTDIDSRFSIRTQKEIDSLYMNSKIAPFFSLSDNNDNNNYLIGGCNYLNQDNAQQTVELAKQIFSGKNANDIPFVKLEKVVKLNKTAIIRHHLEKQAAKIPNVLYVNYPPTFLKKYENNILITIIFLAIVIATAVYLCIRLIHAKKIQEKGNEFQNLYNHLKTTYDTAAFSFCIYDKKGNIILEKSKIQKNLSKEFFGHRLFNNTYLTTREKMQIFNGHGLTKEINLSKTKTYQYIVKPLEHSILAIATDITPIIDERRQKTNLITFLTFIFEISKIGLAYYNLASKDWFATETWCKNMNIDKPDISSIYQNIIEEDRPLIIEYFEKIKKGEYHEPYRKEVQVLKNGTTQWVQLHIFSMPERNLIIVLSVDFEEYKQYENTLKNAQVEAELSNAETDEFLLNISHEIRTPLNAIVGFTNILSIEPSISPDNLSKIKKIITTNITLLRDIIENVLKLSEIDSKNTPFVTAEFDAARILSEIANQAEKKINKNTKIVYSFANENIIINSHAEYFSQLMANLVSNATKFTSEGSITIGYKIENGSHCFFVSDTGCGIDDKDKQLIFKQFYKTNSFTQGIGLGLSICKTIAEYLGGKLSFESELGKGSTFWFTLPKK